MVFSLQTIGAFRGEATEPLRKSYIWLKKCTYFCAISSFFRDRTLETMQKVRRAFFSYRLKIHGKLLSLVRWSFFFIFIFGKNANRSQNTGKLPFSDALRDGPWKIYKGWEPPHWYKLKCIQSWRGHNSVIAPEQQNFFRRNAAAVAIRWWHSGA